MENWAAIIAGLGLFFIGVKQVGHHLKQMAGHRMRAVMTRATNSRLRASLLGLLSGALTQSTNAATFLVVSMVTAGVVSVTSALPIVVWSNVGTSALVMMATLDLRLLAYFLIGMVGVCFYCGLHEKDKWRHLIGAALAICLLFLGLSLIKSGTAPLRHEEWVHEFIHFASGSFLLALLAGAAMTMVAQSSATVSVVALTLLAANMLTLDQTIMLVFGASIGSGATIYMMALNLSGTGRVIALIQVWIKFTGVVILLPVFLLEYAFGWPGVKFAALWLGGAPHVAVAWIYLFLQVAPAIVLTLFSRAFLSAAVRICPPDPTEELAKPVFIYEQAMEEPETALDLVEREQLRLIQRLPRLLENFTTDTGTEARVTPEMIHASAITLMKEITRFMDDLMLHCQTHTALERLMHFRTSQEVVRQLYDTELALTHAVSKAFPNDLALGMGNRLMDSLHAVLSVMADSATDPDLLPTTLILTSDRSEFMKQLRISMASSHSHLDSEALANLFAATSLFERVIWSAHRLAELLAKDRFTTT